MIAQVSEVAPIRHEVVVDLDGQEAFDLFTSRIGDWWPIARHGVFGAAASVAFVDSELIETLDDQRTSWGEVTEWIPARQLSMTWHPGREAEPASSLTVTFAHNGERTVVALEHSDWDAFDDPTAARAEYDAGWPAVLERYAEAARPEREPEAYTWVALIHRPGPEAPKDESIFEDPRFADHTRFLARMQADGYLVAAGPLLDAVGEGMTILRLPGVGRLDDAHHLATTEDPSVTAGFLEVSVRPWQVMMTQPAP